MELRGVDPLEAAPRSFVVARIGQNNFRIEFFGAWRARVQRAWHIFDALDIFLEQSPEFNV
jgi:hypothetical protein